MSLTNFARVYAGMGKTQLDVDFDGENYSRINLFIGDNGSGKTSTMRCIHPFAYNTAVGDDTTSNDFILEGKDGKKTIDILADDGKVYHIEHIYSRKKDGSLNVKSFISEDNEELNTSGTVTTFKTIVSEKLGIDEVYLSLLSIGNSVEGFVNYTAGDRKKIATRIFKELGIYNALYKKLSEKDRSLKTVLNNVVSKLSKYSSIDKTELSRTIADVKKSIDMIESKKIEVNREIGSVNGKLQVYGDTIKEYDSLQHELLDIMNRLSTISSKRITNSSISELHELIDGLLTEIDRDKLDINTVEVQLTNLINEQDKLIKKKTDLSLLIEKSEMGTDIEELLSLKTQLTEEIAVLQGKTISGNIKYGKNDLIAIENDLNELNHICNKFLYDVINQDLITEFIEKYNVGIYNGLISKRDRLISKLDHYKALVSNGKINFSIPVAPRCSDKDTCPYKEFYDNYVRVMNQSDDTTRNQIIQMQEDLSKINDLIAIIDIVKMAEDFISKSRLKDFGFYSVFDKEVYLAKYMETKSCYDEDLLHEIISNLESIDKLSTLEDKLSVVQDKISVYNDKISIYNRYKSEHKEVSDDLELCETKINHVKSKIESVTNHMMPLEEKYKTLCDEIELVEKYNALSGEKDRLTQDSYKLNETMSVINGLKEKLDQYHKELTQCNELLASLYLKRDNLTRSLDDIESLEKEEIQLREKYDKVKNIRFAVSPTTGIPLEYIEYYIREEMCDKMNDLLDSVYHGRLRILKDGIIVNDDEFTIPYIKNNTTVVKDISKASDGERAIMTLAFSMVLMSISAGSQYTVVLLDEIDTTLDASSRGKFLDLLEHFMDVIKSEQVFIISHNNMFDAYPVTVYLTSPSNDSFNYTRAKVVPLY